MRIAVFLAIFTILAPSYSAPMHSAQNDQPSSTTYTFKTIGDNRIQADVHRLPGDDIRPVIVWIHGGALITGNRGNLNKEQRDRYLKAGYVIVAIDYRLAPETKLKAIIADVQDAFRWVRDKGPELYKIDPKRIAVVGHSAGGYLTLMTGFAVQPRPQALVAFYGYGDIIEDWYAKPDPFYRKQPLVSKEEALGVVGVQDISDSRLSMRNRSRFYLYCRQNGLWPKEVVGHDPIADPKAFFAYRPVRHVSKGLYPPTLLLHGDEDTDVPYQQSVDLAKELERNQIPHQFITMKGYGHGFDGKGMKDAKVAAAFDQVEAFLKKHMAP